MEKQKHWMQEFIENSCPNLAAVKWQIPFAECEETEAKQSISEIKANLLFLDEMQGMAQEAEAQEFTNKVNANLN